MLNANKHKSTVNNVNVKLSDEQRAFAINCASRVLTERVLFEGSYVYRVNDSIATFKLPFIGRFGDTEYKGEVKLRVSSNETRESNFMFFTIREDGGKEQIKCANESERAEVFNPLWSALNRGREVAIITTPARNQRSKSSNIVLNVAIRIDDTVIINMRGYIALSEISALDDRFAKVKNAAKVDTSLLDLF